MASNQFSPEVIAHAFVSQYYHILHQSPEHVHRFYQDTSTMTRHGPDGLITVTTMARIKDLVASLACHEYRAEIMTVDAQDSFKGGVLVLVTGCLIGKDNLRQEFSETFFLAPQEIGYYVHNNVFRFIGEDRAPGGVSNLNDSAQNNAKSMTPEPDSEGCKTSSPEVPAAVEAVSNCDVEIDEPHVEIPAAQESVSVAEPQAEELNQKDNQPVEDSVSNVSEDAPKKSYASILKVLKERKEDPTQAASRNVKSSSLVKETQQHAGKLSAPGELPPNGVLHDPVRTGQQSAEAVRESSTSTKNGGNGNDRTDQVADAGKGYSIYIGNLPYNASVSLIENEFKRFGPIRRGGVQVRWNKDFCFGFVEFESLDSMEKAVQTSKLHIGGYDVFIQKKTSPRGVNGTNSFLSSGGRGGGYRNNNGFRGQDFSGGVGGRYVGYSGRNNDYGSGGYRGRNNDYGISGYSGRNNNYRRRDEDYFYPNGPKGRTVGGRGGGYRNDRVYQNGEGKASRQVRGDR